jgi:hypothetical protein
MSNRRLDMKRQLIIGAIIYVVCVVLASFLWQKPVILFLCYLLISIVMLWKWHTRSDLVFYFVAFLLGSMADIIAVHFGAWEYSKPFYLIPSWLPFLWGITALFIKKISEALVKTV